MFVEQLPSGRYRGGYRLPNGKKATRTFEHRHLAEDWAEREEARAFAPTPAEDPARPTPTIATRGAAWLRRKSGLASQTLSGYGTHYRAIAASQLGAMRMGEVRRDDVLDWRADQLDAGVGRATINARLKVLRMIYRDAAANLVVTHDPTHEVEELTTGARPDRVFTPAEQAALLGAADPMVADMVLVALGAGLRWQEVAALTASAVMGDYLIVRAVMERDGTVREYTKGARGEGHRGRVVPMGTPTLVAAMTARAAAATDPDALLFTAPDGGPVDYYNWRRRAWRPALKAAGILPMRTGKTTHPVRFHDLRHTYATALAAAGVPRAEIAKLLGHADEATTKRYVHEGDDGRRRDLVRDALGWVAPEPDPTPAVAGRARLRVVS